MEQATFLPQQRTNLKPEIQATIGDTEIVKGWQKLFKPPLESTLVVFPLDG